MTEPNEIPLWVDIAYKLAIVIIAFVNLGFTIFFFYTKINRDNDISEKTRKLGLLKTVILDHTMGNFYKIFEDLEDIIEKLESNTTLNDRMDIVALSDYKFISLRRKFTDSFLNVNRKLYADILAESDSLQEKITEYIFSNDFEEKIGNDTFLSETITKTKSTILGSVFSYRG